MSRFNHLVSAYRSLTQEPRPVVLATLIATEGSTYQKAGARMLIDAYGELTGILGGGCFEQDLIEHGLCCINLRISKLPLTPNPLDGFRV